MKHPVRAVGVLVAILAVLFFMYYLTDTPDVIVSPEIVVGQNIVVGIQGPTLDDSTRQFLKLVRPAGIIFYKQNIRSLKQVTDLIQELQDLAASTTGLPYLIMMDEEPMGATRLRLFQDAFSNGVPNWSAIERDIQVLAGTGVNVNLAPIADYPFVQNSFISTRLQVMDVDAMTAFNTRFIGLLHRYGVGATLKHFPGLGVFTEDPHRGVVRTNASTSTLQKAADVFTKGREAGASFVMTNHGIYSSLDSVAPATYSRPTIDFLTREVGFKGIVITDDISDMPLPANSNEGIPGIALASLRAGHTLVLFSRNRPVTEESWHYLLEHYQHDPKVKQILDANYRKVAAYKTQYVSPSK